MRGKPGKAALRRVLIIVQDFPPLGGGGVLRTVKFAKYLPEFGWQPVILTLREEYYLPHLLDPTLLADLPPGLEIHRTPSLKPRGRTRAGLVAASGSAAQGGASRAAALVRAAKRALERRFLVYQDEGYLWIPYARPAVRQILAGGTIDAVISTSPPHGIHWLGAYAQRLGRIPWIADFRDGWTHHKLFQSRSATRNRLERRQERQILRRADKVTTATEGFHNWFVEDHGEAYVRKALVLHNGFDPADFPETPAQERNDGRLLLAHVGGAGGARRPVGPLLEAVRRLSAEAGPQNPLRLRFVGSMAAADLPVAQTTPGVELLPFVPHAQAVEEMRCADALVLIQSRDEADAHTGKLFEYVAAQRPILTLTFPGLLADLVREEQWGWVANPEDPEAILAALSEIVALWQQGALAQVRPSAAARSRFDRRAQTGLLAGALDELVAQKAGVR